MRSIPRRLSSLLIAALLGVGALGVLSEFWFLDINVSRRTGDYYNALICRHSVTYVASNDPLSHLMFPQGRLQWRLTWSVYSVSRAKISTRNWWPATTPRTLNSQRQTIIPFWWAAPLAVVLFVSRVLLRRMLRKPYECRGCRYDLRGLPNDAAACPECGAQFAAGASGQVG
jgi:hypothetical protein